MGRKIAIVYTSYSGNTKDLAHMMKSILEDSGHCVHIFSHRDTLNLSTYDYILFGSLTWDNGSLPIQCRKLLKEVLVENPQVNSKCSVFGTGETQWGEENFCKAVDEMKYHLSKHGIIVDYTLKIEQNPLGKESLVHEYVNNILEELLICK